jgi:hypothetical protein
MKQQSNWFSQGKKKTKLQLLIIGRVEETAKHLDLTEVVLKKKCLFVFLG